MAGTRKAGRKKQPAKQRRSRAHAKTAPARHRRELAEARQRLAAAAEILSVISRSPTDVQPVFEAIAEHSMRLLGGLSATVTRRVGDALHLAALTSTSPSGDDALRKRFPFSLARDRDRALVQAVLGRAAVQVTDTEDTHTPPTLRELARRRGYRSILVAPMLSKGEAIGTVSVTRREAGKFSDHDVELLKTFADQAVIAIENVRLFNETKEALERQTATAAILKVIARSPSDVRPVFEAIVKSALALCKALYANAFLFDGEMLHFMATEIAADGFGGRNIEFSQIRKILVESIKAKYPMLPDASQASGRVILTKAVARIEDLAEDPNYDTKLGLTQIARRMLAVPMTREGAPIGVIVVAWSEPGPIARHHEELLQTFADQAVIAIENVRLFNETKEALEQQTATAEILRVISSTPTNVQPVFDAIVESALQIFSGAQVAILLAEANQMRVVAAAGGVSRVQRGDTVARSRDSASGTAVLERKVVNIADIEAPGAPANARDSGRAQGFRSLAAAPLLRDGQPIGAINVFLKDRGGLNDKQLALLKTFGDQAVIAIENVRLFNETKEALEQQTATAEILKVISGSPTDIQPVLEAVGENAARLCEANNAVIFRLDGEGLRQAASYGHIPTTSHPRAGLPVTRGTVTGRSVFERRTIHVHDLSAEASEFPQGSAHAKVDGHRTTLATPLLREGVPVGAILIRRMEVRPFTEKQIALLETFAHQAAIAIQNTRQFNETKEALERQTATAEILEVISRSQTDLQPVFDTIAANAMQLCDGDQGLVFSFDGKLIHIASIKAMAPEEERSTRRDWPRPPSRGTVTSRAVLTRAVVHVPDVQEDPEYEIRDTARAGGWRAAVSVPMLRGGNPIGAITVLRRQPTPYSEDQIALLKTFADQAVIAIENVRLFNETKEALEQQTATAEILRVISSTPTEVQPVFDAIVQSALRIFSGMRVGILLDEGDQLRVIAVGGQLSRVRKGLPVPRTRDSASGQALLERSVVNVVDTEAPDAPRAARDNGRADGFRAMAATPLLREGSAIGVITVFLREPGGLSEKQLALLKTFADQAVIAIENTRLFRELEARTEALSKSVGQFKALGEVGQAISSTLDFEKVLQTIVERAVELTGLDGGAIYEYDEDRQVFDLRSAENFPQEIISAFRRAPLRLGEGAVGLAGLTREAVQVGDILEEGYQSHVRELLISARWRALLAVPLLREGHILGALAVTRGTPGPFAPEVIELLETFATQSAIAIQNARLFREIEEKGHQLEVASRHKSDFLASMSHELRTPLNAILGFNEMILDGVYGETPPDMRDPLADIQTSGKHLLRLINNVLDLAKIEAGRMELALADYSVHDVVESVRTTLRPLAEAKGLEFLAAVPQDLPLAHGDPGRLTQCLMNLAGNSLKFTRAGRVSIAVEQNGGGTLVWRVADTGIGIPPDKIGSLFTEFKQTDATIASEYGGTGLGLSITRKFVEMHGGRIWVESEPGKGSVFIFEVPLRAQSA